MKSKILHENQQTRPEPKIFIIYLGILDCIRTAEHYIYIENQFFVSYVLDEEPGMFSLHRERERERKREREKKKERER